MNRNRWALLKEKLKASNNPLNEIKGICKGQTVLVVSAGPSAKNWRDVYSNIENENPVIACVKQTVTMAGLDELCDIHFFNPYNLTRYRYANEKIRVFSDDAVDAPKTYADYDIYYSVHRESDTLDTTLAARQNFEDYTIEKSGIVRPWGPGIMHESVIYTLLHMGFSKIVTIGWDIGGADGDNTHFYDKKTQAKKSLSIVIFNKLRLSKLLNYYLYLVGKKYNYAGMMNGEVELTSASICALKKWLSTKGVELVIYSGSKWMDFK